MVILTYHKILGATPSEFYANSADQLRSHIDLLISTGFRPLAPEQMLDAAPPARSFILTFDDGTRDHGEIAANVLEEKKMKGVFFIATAKIGRSAKYLTEAGVKELADRGHMIGCHSHFHQRMDRMEDQEVAEQLDISLAELTGMTGTAPWFFAPPGGFSSSRIRKVAASRGIRALRTMKWGINRTVDLLDLQCVPLNRRSDANRLGKVLDGKGERRTATVYFAKELLKKLVPMKTYAQLRRIIVNR